MSIKRKAGGFRNPANFTTAIYFHCGGLDLYLPEFGWFRGIYTRPLNESAGVQTWDRMEWNCEHTQR